MRLSNGIAGYLLPIRETRNYTQELPEIPALLKALLRARRRPEAHRARPTDHRSDHEARAGLLRTALPRCSVFREEVG